MLVPGCMWHVMHWLVGMLFVIRCRIGCPGSVFEIIGSEVNESPLLPTLASVPEWTGELSFAYVTWQAVHPLDRKSPPMAFAAMKLIVGSSKRSFCRPMKTG